MLLDKIDRKYWQDYSAYDRRSKIWWDNNERSLW